MCFVSHFFFSVLVLSFQDLRESLALTIRSLKFFERLCPIFSLRSCIGLVWFDLSKRSHFFLT